MFDAGAVVGKFIMDGSQWTKGMGSITGSMFKGQLAFAAFQKAADFVVNSVGDCVKAFAEQQKASAQMTAVLKSTGYAAGITQKELEGMANALQKTTTYADETIMSAQNLLLTFTKVGKDIFPQATQTILDMSTALGTDLKSTAIQVGKALQDPILGVTALRRVGVNFNKEQMAVIKNLVETGRSAEAQAMILKELQTEFGGSAEAAGKTFAGSLAILQNQFGETQETIGSYMVSVGKPFVDQLRSIVDGINDWLTSAEGISVMTNIFATLAGTGAVVQKLFEKIGEIWTDMATNIIDPIATALSGLTGKGSEAIPVFAILGKVVDVIGMVLGTVSRIIGGTTGAIINLVSSIWESLVLIQKIDAYMKGGMTQALWDDMTAQADKAGKSWETFGNSVKDTVTGVTEYGKSALNDLLFGANDTGAGFENAFKEAGDGVRAGMLDMGKEIQETMKTVGEDSAGAASQVTKSWQETFAELSADLDRATQEFGVGSMQWQASFAAVVKHVEAGMQGIFDTVNSVWGAISGVLSQANKNQMTELDKQYEAQKAQIEATVTDEEAKTEALATLDAKYEAEKKKLQREAFEVERAGNILSTIMNTAVGVTNALATVPWPFNFIVAGIIGGLGAVQTALVASQVNPYANGGVAHGWSLVGEQGPELMNVGSPSRILPADETAAALGGAGDTNVNFYGDVNTELDVARIMQLAGAAYNAKRKGA